MLNLRFTDSVTKAASTMITEIVLGYIAIILLITILRIAGKAFDIPIENPIQKKESKRIAS